MTATRAAEFDHIISLGGRCQVAYQLRRYFHIEAAQLFDWWVTPTTSLLYLLENDFIGLFQPQNIDFSNSIGAAACKRTGLLHFHDFPHDPATGVIRPETIADMCMQNRRKYCLLIARFRALSGRILFIRYGKGFHVGTDQNVFYTRDNINRLIRALALHFSDFRLLLLTGDNSEPPDDFDALRGRVDARVMFDAIDNQGANDWRGRAETWTELFGRLGGPAALRCRG